MVEEQVVSRGVADPAVLDAMRSVERHRFVPEGERSRAYDDGPLSIGHGQTISQPYIVALMTELSRSSPASRVLEVGTGCGYQTAVLARCAREVFTIEIDARPVGSRGADAGGRRRVERQPACGRRSARLARGGSIRRDRGDRRPRRGAAGASRSTRRRAGASSSRSGRALRTSGRDHARVGGVRRRIGDPGSLRHHALMIQAARRRC